MSVTSSDPFGPEVEDESWPELPGFKSESGVRRLVRAAGLTCASVGCLYVATVLVLSAVAAFFGSRASDFGREPSGPTDDGTRVYVTTIDNDASARDRLTGRPNAEAVYVSKARAVTDEGLRALANCNGLEGLVVNGCPHVTGEFLVDLTLTELQSVHVSACPRFHARHLSGLTQLTSVFIIDCREIDADALASVAELKQLEEVCLGPSLLGDDDLAVLSSLPALASLRLLDWPLITDDALRSLPRSLRELTLAGCPGLTDEAVDHLGAFPHLQQLTIREPSPFTAAAIDVLRGQGVLVEQQRRDE